MIKNRSGAVVSGGDAQDRLLAALYGNPLGRMLLRPLVSPVVSSLWNCCIIS